MDRESSSDEEEHLIHQNNIPKSPFQIDNNKSPRHPSTPTFFFNNKSNAKNPSCFFPIPQAAECISRLVERANIPVIYLSTDAAESETGLLQSLITNGNTVHSLQRRLVIGLKMMLLYRKKVDGDTPGGGYAMIRLIQLCLGVSLELQDQPFTRDILFGSLIWKFLLPFAQQVKLSGEVLNFIAGDE
ncbi:hypothetical protein Tco_0811807 [Tanacetum coccineum]